MGIFAWCWLVGYGLGWGLKGVRMIGDLEVEIGYEC